MAHTSHGHHIPGTIFDDCWSGSVARCGGPGLCSPCAGEAAWYGFFTPTETSIPVPDTNDIHLQKARNIVFDYVKRNLEKTDTHVKFTPEDVYIVTFAFTLGNWKAMISTTLPDGMYYEVTHNRTKRETYLDAYKKFDNACIPD